MPELPEVEIIKRIIEPQIQNQIVTSVVSDKPNVIAHPTFKIFCESLKGRTMLGMGRRGKYLTILLDDKSTLIIHLRMTGQLICVQKDYPERPHTHVAFQLGDKLELRYIDVRRLGHHIWLKRGDEEDTFSGMDKLGLEPFDRACNGQYLKDKFENRRITVKQALMEQSVIAGIGNIYSDEILFAAGIHPSCPVSKIEADAWQKIAVTTRAILNQFIEYNAMSPEEYLLSESKEYRNTPYLQVYGREKATCKKCGQPIERIKIAGRSSNFCPSCQERV